MFRIGDFAKLNKISVKTLRYYDEIGLLKPARIDVESGYRYYSASQVPRLHRIIALKEMELSLTDIALLLNDRLPADEAAAMIQHKAAEIEQEIRDKSARLERLLAWMKAMHSGEMKREMKVDRPLFQQVVLKKLDPVLVAGIRTTLEDYAQQQPLWEELVTYLLQRNIRVQTPIAIYYGAEPSTDEGVEMEAAVQVNEKIPETGRIRLHPLEGVREMACLIHEGKSDLLADTYAALQQWIELNGYRVSGPVREKHIQGYLTHANPEEHVTEIQIPVSKLG